jgi:uncharacterized delta-60 repeat protein
VSARRSRSHRTLVSLTLIAALALLTGGVASAAPGDVDASFGDAGSKTVPVGNPADVAGLVRRGDGSFVIGASVTGYAMTVALKPNGQLLKSYGSSGISSVPVPGSSSVTIRDIAIRPNDLAVVAGDESAMSGSDRFVVARFRADGEPDASFSDDGVTRIGFPQGDAYGYGVAIQPDGKIVVVGEVQPASGVSNPAILRLNPNGTLDRTFGDGGRRVVKLKDGVAGYDAPWRVVVQAHGKLAMAGWTDRGNGNYRTLAMRLKPGGVLDRTFGGDGVAVVDADGMDNWAYGLAKDGDKLVLGLHVDSNAAGILRLNGNGTRDRTFGGDGVATHALSVPWEVEAVAVRAGDHAIVGVNGLSSGPNVVRFRSGGKLDGGFGSGGEAVGPLTNEAADGVVLMSNGKVVLAGASGSDVFAVRFLGP